MGRKIPGKKHRGIKDPVKQHARRQAELECKANAPPKDVDEQAVPRSLQRVVALKEAVKSGRISKVKKRRKKPSLIRVAAPPPPPHPKARPEKVVPVFQQRPGESAQRFLHRVDTETYAFLNETAFEKKYGVQVERDPETGEVEGLSKLKKSEVDELEKLRARHRNIKRSKGQERMTKTERRKEKMRLKKEAKETEAKDEFEDLRDQVRFGEVVHEPPQLKTRPKKADASDSSKPGKKTLLLHSLLVNSNAPKNPATSRASKRKNLPAGERRQLEKQQSDVIAAYRRLKAQRSSGRR